MLRTYRGGRPPVTPPRWEVKPFEFGWEKLEFIGNVDSPMGSALCSTQITPHNCVFSFFVVWSLAQKLCSCVKNNFISSTRVNSSLALLLSPLNIKY